MDGANLSQMPIAQIHPRFSAIPGLGGQGAQIKALRGAKVDEFHLAILADTHGYGSKLSTPKMNGFPTKHDQKSVCHLVP